MRLARIEGAKIMSRQPYYPGVNLREQTQAHAPTGVVSAFMNMVYAWMCVGLAVTAGVAYWVATQQPDILLSLSRSFGWVLLFAVQIGLVFAISYAIYKIPPGLATILFLIYSALTGLTFSVVFLIYAPKSIAVAFGATAGMFAVMSVVGFVTKKDLTGLGSFLFMALVGLVLASIVNWFVRSPALNYIISYVAVFVFLGLTAYDTQKLKEYAWQTEGDAQMASRLAIVGSLMLYLDFINIFWSLLHILGDRE
jgi:FtsH-binding integral membrane protein